MTKALFANQWLLFLSCWLAASDAVNTGLLLWRELLVRRWRLIWPITVMWLTIEWWLSWLRFLSTKAHQVNLTFLFIVWFLSIGHNVLYTGQFVWW